MEALAFGLFALTGVWVWLITLLWVILAFTYTERESGVGLLFVTLGALALFHCGGVFNVLAALFANPLTSVITIIAYFVAGTFWTLIKFKLYARKIRINLNERMAARPKSDHAYAINSTIESLQFTNNKANLMRWAVWWPISLIWTALRDVIRDIFDYIITDILGKMLQKIADDEIKKIDKPTV